MSTKKVLVLGGNFAGLTAALSVEHELGNDVDVTVVSKSDRFQLNHRDGDERVRAMTALVVYVDGPGRRGERARRVTARP